jgi:hypothetical protein
MENSSCKKPRESQKPVVRTIPSRNSNQPETRINVTKEIRTNAAEIIAAMKSPFGHSDAECRDPHNPKGVNANNARRNDRNNNRDRNHQQDRNYQNNQDS